MCQLSLISLNNSKYNIDWEYIQSYVNSKTTNKHGWGMFIKNGGICKIGDDASTELDLYKMIAETVGRKTGPILSHVRFATSYGVTNKKKEPSCEKSHPFETDYFVLAHNGSLTLKDTKLHKKEFDDLIDSEIFLFLLTEEYIKNGNDFILAIKETMNKHYGKFAFLIYEKLKDKYWIIRGDALLHYFQIKREDGTPIGIVVNTQLDSLRESLILMSNLLSKHGVTFKLDEDEKIYILERETIYELENGYDVVERGKIKVNDPPKIVEVVQTYYNDNFWNKRDATRRTETITNNVLKEIGKRMKDFSVKTGLLTFEMESLFMELTGIPFLYGEFQDFKMYVTLLELIEPLYSKEKEDLYYSLLGKGLIHGVNFQFPYFLESEQDLRKLLNEKSGVLQV